MASSTTSTFSPSHNLPINPDFGKSEIEHYVSIMLGGSDLDVELHEEDYVVAIEEAFEKYSRSIPFYGHYNLLVSHDEKKYKLPYTGRGVLEVRPNRNQSFLVPGSSFSLNIGDGIVTTVVPVLKESYGIDEINEVLNYSEEFRRIVSWDFQWDIYGDYIYVTNLPPEVDELSIIYADDHNFHSLPRGDRDWIKEYVLAVCKLIVGRKRYRYPVPGPAGQQLLQDSLQILEEGKEERTRLLEELSRRYIPLPPTWDSIP